MAWGTVESNRFGTHDFLNYCEMLGYRALHLREPRNRNVGGSAAVGGILNSSEDTAMTRLRKQNGRRDPWKVTYWGLGNEMDGPWQMGHQAARTIMASSRWKPPS